MLRSYGRACMFSMKPPAAYGACRASLPGPDCPTKFSLLIKSLRKSFARRRCRSQQTHRLNPTSNLTFCQTVQVAIVVIGRRFLHELQNLEHPFALFAIHLAELHGYSRARMQSGYNPFGG